MPRQKTKFQTFLKSLRQQFYLPNKQAQVYVAGALIQSPPFSQGDARHSSTSSSHNSPVQPEEKKIINYNIESLVTFFK